MSNNMNLLSKTEQLERILRLDLSSDAWVPGTRLPSEDALMERFRVSRPSMREALNTLVADGIVTRKHGSGTFLVRRPTNRIEVFMRLENIATVAGYWYRDMLHAFQTLGVAHGIAVEAVLGFGVSTLSVAKTLERQLCRPSSCDLIGAVSLLMSDELNRELTERLSVPISALGLVPRHQPREVVLDYAALADAFRATMLERGYEDFTLVYCDDPPAKVGKKSHREVRALCDRITGGDRSRQLGISTELADEAEYQRYLETRFLAWYKSPARTRAAVFFDDGIFSNCCRVMFAHGIRIPRDLAVLTHANVGRVFDFPFTPDRIGFNAKAAARAMWDAVLDKPTVSNLIAPIVMPGSSLPRDKAAAKLRQPQEAMP